ncbi:MAG: dihydrodipicolinate synthase family protein [Bryobacterales bacterium]|nr:dihydrodipicolinate synthase family protein [Bryobacterales bacterium]
MNALSTRRDCLRALAGAGLLASCGHAAPDPRFRGIFPIVQTPFTKANEIDHGALGKQIEFLDRAGVHGIVWPQRASEYAFLSREERLRGAEAVMRLNKGRKPVVVLGVQGPDTASAVEYARHADKLGPDAIIALPTRDRGEFDLDEVLAYYKAVGKACKLPMFVQTTGNMSVEFVLKLAREVPSVRFAKDETGNVLYRINEFRAGDPAGRVTVFSGAHGRTLIDEIMRGGAGTMPAASWADLYVKVWDAWHANRKQDAYDIFAKLLLLVVPCQEYGFAAIKYILHLRGIFPNWDIRAQTPPLDEDAQNALREVYEVVKPLFV